MNSWLDSRWIIRLAGVPPMLSGRTTCFRSSVISYSLSDDPFGRCGPYVMIHSRPAHGTTAPVPHSFSLLNIARCG